MRTVRIDFTAENILPDGEYIGRMGEHNATDLVITPPEEMSACDEIINYVVAFVTEGKIIRSDFYEKAQTVTVPLCSQLTQDHTLSVQLEGYDSNGGLLVKSAILTELKLLPSAGGDDTEFTSESTGLVSQINLNTLARHSHSNKSVLDALGDISGVLTFNGEPVTSGKVVVKELDYNGGEIEVIAEADSVQVCCYPKNDGSFEIKEGSRILSVEYMLMGSENGEWTDIRDSIKSDIYSSYSVIMNKAFVNSGMLCLAVVCFINMGSNELYLGASNYMISKVRVTYTEPDGE